MKRFPAKALLLAAALLAVSAVTAWAATVSWYNAKGYVYYYTSQGVETKKMFLQVRDVNQFLSPHIEQHFRCYFEDVEIQVPVTEIRSLVRDEGGNTVIVTRLDGYSYRAVLPKDMGDSLTGFSWPGFLLFNEITGSFEEGYLDGKEITRIEFVDSF